MPDPRSECIEYICALESEPWNNVQWHSLDAKLHPSRCSIGAILASVADCYEDLDVEMAAAGAAGSWPCHPGAVHAGGAATAAEEGL